MITVLPGMAAPSSPSLPSSSPPPLTPEAAGKLLGLLPAAIGPGLSERELDAVEARFGFSFSADHRVFLAAGLPHGSPSWPDWRHGDPEDLAARLERPAEGALFDVEHNRFWHPDWAPRPAETADALRVARAELATVPRLVPVYGHRYLPGTAGEWGHPVLSVHQTDIIFYGNDLADYVRHEFTGRASPLPARATVDFWSYFVGSGPCIDVTAPTPHRPCAVTAQEAVEYLRMLGLERLIGRRFPPHQLIEAGLTALVLDVESESLPLLAGLLRTEHERADALFDRVLAEVGPGEVGVGEVGVGEVGAGEVRAGEVRAAQVGGGEVFSGRGSRLSSEDPVRWELVRWWLRLVVNGSMDPAAAGDVITYEGRHPLGRPPALRRLVETVDAHHDWAAQRDGTLARPGGAIVAEAERLLAGPWPPPDTTVPSRTPETS